MHVHKERLSSGDSHKVHEHNDKINGPIIIEKKVRAMAINHSKPLCASSN